MEDKFEQLFELKEDEQIEKNIIVSINKRIIKNVVLSIITILLIIVSVYYGTDFIVRKTNYDPYSEKLAAQLYEKREGKSLSTQGEYAKIDWYLDYYDFLMNNYVSIFGNGKDYNNTTKIEYVGFGKYIVEGSWDNNFSNDINQKEPVMYAIEKSKIILPLYGGHEFTCNEETSVCEYGPDFDTWKEKQKYEMIEEVRKMPESSFYEIYVTYRNPIALDHWNEKNIPSYEYRFVLTNNQMTGEYMGFSFTGIDGYSYIETMEETPSYHISGFEENTSNDFYEYYKTRLMTLLKHENFLKALDFRSEKTHKVLIEEELERIEKKELEVKGYLAHVSKEEMLEILNDENTFYVKIEDAKYSIYEK